MKPRALNAVDTATRRMWCVLYPDGRVMNADQASDAYGRSTPALYRTRSDAQRAIFQRNLPDSMSICRIITVARWTTTND